MMICQTLGPTSHQVDVGVDGIWVSNHGGRQLDHGHGCLTVLPNIASAVAKRATCAHAHTHAHTHALLFKHTPTFSLCCCRRRCCLSASTVAFSSPSAPHCCYCFSQWTLRRAAAPLPHHLIIPLPPPCAFFFAVAHLPFCLRGV